MFKRDSPRHDHFPPARRARGDYHGTLRQAKSFRQKFQQGLIGRTFNRRRRQPNLDPAIMYSNDFGLRGTRLNQNMQLHSSRYRLNRLMRDSTHTWKRPRSTKFRRI